METETWPVRGYRRKYHRELEDIGRAASMDTETWPSRRSVEENLSRELEDMGCVVNVATEIWPVREVSSKISPGIGGYRLCSECGYQDLAFQERYRRNLTRELQDMSCGAIINTEKSGFPERASSVLMTWIFDRSIARESWNGRAVKIQQNTDLVSSE